MKKLSFLVLLFLMIFILGCTEKDVIDPVFQVELHEYTIMQGESIDLVATYGVSASDNQDGLILISCNIEDTSQLDLGVYLVEFTAEDAQGNQATTQTTLIVEDEYLGFTVDGYLGVNEGDFHQVLEPVVINQRAFILYQSIMTETISSSRSESQVNLLVYDALSKSMITLPITEVQYNAKPIGMFGVDGGYNIVVNIQESADDPYTVWIYHFDYSLEFLYRSEIKEAESTLSKVVTNSNGSFAIVYDGMIEFYQADETFIIEKTIDSYDVINDFIAVGNTFVFVGKHVENDISNGFLLSFNPSTQANFTIEDTECNVKKIDYFQISDANGKLYISAWFEDAVNTYSAIIECTYDGEYITEHTYLPTDDFKIFSLFDSPVGLGPTKDNFESSALNHIYIFGNGLHPENNYPFMLYQSSSNPIYFQIEKQYYALVVHNLLRLNNDDDNAFPQTANIIQIEIK